MLEQIFNAFVFRYDVYVSFICLPLFLLATDSCPNVDCFHLITSIMRINDLFYLLFYTCTGFITLTMKTHVKQQI